MGHTASDLFNRSGVALLSPFRWERVRFPLVSWGDLPLTIGAVAVAGWVVMAPGFARMASLAGLAGYVVYLMRRRRAPNLSDPISRWWFGMMNGPDHAAGGSAFSGPRGRDDNRGANA